MLREALWSYEDESEQFLKNSIPRCEHEPSIQLIPSKVYIMQMKISEFRCRPVRSASRIRSKQDLEKKEDTGVLPLSDLDLGNPYRKLNTLDAPNVPKECPSKQLSHQNGRVQK